ncbi:MAG TPA: hypothetical protein VMD47_12025 [Candidatus Acidoferrales bacterium]|nr:hypothetical protein [Candidatus Acidoferrales bacterium]
MITEHDEVQRERDRANLAWSILGALPVTIAFWVLLTSVLALQPGALLKLLAPHAEPTPEMIVMSTAKIELERRPVPEPPRPRVRHQEQRPVPQKPEPKPEETAPPTPQTQPTELSRLAPHATPEASPAKTIHKRASLAETLAQEQVAFAKEAAQLNASRAPLSAATIDPNQRASSNVPFQMNMSGLPGMPRRGQGVISVISSIEAPRGYDCYYGHYTFTYPNGDTEEGDIPWPFCFPTRIDPFIRYYTQRMGMPLPRPGYQLPPGMVLKPQLKIAYQYYEYLLEHQ